MKKIKIFLGAFINSTNAQNLNCLALAKHLDKEKFDVLTLTVYSGDLGIQKINNVRTFNCFYPFEISKYIGYLWGIFHADVIYLPKGKYCKWNKFWIRFFKKKSFRTVEGIIGKEMLDIMLSEKKSYEAFQNSFKGYDRLYSITQFLARYNEEHHGIKSEPKPLYLGTDLAVFINEKKCISKLHNIIFIGRLKKRKGVFDVLEIAKCFPSLDFFIAGNGEDEKAIQSYIETNNLENVKLLGTLTHSELAETLKKMDLHLFPSRSEGFPKVTLETAAAGVPSLVYSDYGADEWITDGENGFIVDTVEEMKNVIQELRDNPQMLQQVSKNAIKLAKRFDWKVIIKDWERVIEELYES
ncbi:glycosyltransferase family 4 protein [Hydrogenimonas sp.]